MSLASYDELKDSGKQRLAAAFVNIKNQKSAMTKVYLRCIYGDPNSAHHR